MFLSSYSPPLLLTWSCKLLCMCVFFSLYVLSLIYHSSKIILNFLVDYFLFHSYSQPKEVSFIILEFFYFDLCILEICLLVYLYFNYGFIYSILQTFINFFIQCVHGPKHEYGKKAEEFWAEISTCRVQFCLSRD